MYRNNENNEFRQRRLAKSIFLGIIAQINPQLAVKLDKADKIFNTVITVIFAIIILAVIFSMTK